MKRSLIILVALLFITASNYAQDVPEKVKGGFRKCEVYSYEYKFGQIDKSAKIKDTTIIYDSNGNIIEFIDKDFDSHECSHTIKYDFNGKKIELANYNSEGSIDNKYIYRYNEKGYLCETTNYDSEGKVLFKINYAYDKFGNIVEEIHFYSNGLISNKNINKYDKKGKVIEIVRIDDVGTDIEKKFISKFKNKYDKNTNLIEIISEFNTMPEWNTKNIYIYDFNGRIVEWIIYNSKKVITSKSSFKYDNYGNKIEVISYNKLNEPVSKTEYVYSK